MSPRERPNKIVVTDEMNSTVKSKVFRKYITHVKALRKSSTGGILWNG